MIEVYRCASAELLKLKRTLALRLAAGAPLAVVLLNFIVYAQRRSATGGGENPLIGFAQLNLTIWTIILLPVYAALATALVAAVEHQGDNSKHLFALPVSRRSIFVGKWVAGAGLLHVSSLMLPAGVSVASEILRAIRPDLHAASTPAVLVTVRSLQTFCASGLLLSIQMWVSLRWRSFIAGPAVGAVGLMMLLGGVARSGLGTIVVYLYPWALPPTARPGSGKSTPIARSWRRGASPPGSRSPRWRAGTSPAARCSRQVRP